MNGDDLLNLFDNDKLLVRAMDPPNLTRNGGGLAYDFTTWAEEIDIAKNDRLTCLSSTLLVKGKKIPTYKNLGFIVNSEKAEIVHVSDKDSGSSGNITDGTFFANKTDLHTLSELADRTREKNLSDMNEVNINIKDDAIVGLFFNKALSDHRSKAFVLMAQEYYKMQTGVELPIFIYDTEKGDLQPLNMSDKEKTDFLNDMKKENIIRSLTISYDLYTDFSNESKQKTIAGAGSDNDRKETKFRTAAEQMGQKTAQAVAPQTKTDNRQKIIQAKAAGNSR